MFLLFCRGRSGYFVRERSAAARHVRVSALEIAGVPRVGNVAFLPGEAHQPAHLVRAAERALHVAQILPVHNDDEIGGSELLPRDQTGGAAGIRHSVRVQRAARGRINVRTYLVGAGGAAYDLAAAHSPAREDVFHYEFRHGRTAYIAVADEYYFHIGSVFS